MPSLGWQIGGGGAKQSCRRDTTIHTSQVTDGTANIQPGQVAEASYVWEDNPYIKDEPFDRLMAYDASNLKLSLKDFQLVANDAASPSPTSTPTTSPTPTPSPTPTLSPTPTPTPTPQIIQGDYFPLVMGAEWEYVISYSDQKYSKTPMANITDTVYEISNGNSQTTAKVLRHYKSDVLSEEATYDIQFVKTDLETFQIGDTGTKSVYFKIPMTVGSTFQTGVEVNSLDIGGSLSISGTVYPETIRIRTENKTAGFKHIYYAKNIGMILWETKDFKSDGTWFIFTRELVRFTKP